MNIKEAKDYIKDSVSLYLKKDEFGEYRIPIIRQRPIFLLGAPGIGKTAIMEQIEKHEFENLKGLIYFTDGYGIYPEFMPPFETIFAFLNEDDQKPKVPVWAIEVVLSEPDIEGFETENQK